MSTMRTSRPISMLLPVLLIALASPFLIAAGGGDMVWVCKYVATPDGLHLVPKAGTNPTQVSANSVGDGTFADAHASLIFTDPIAPDCNAENPNPPPATTCVGAIAAAMVDGSSRAVPGGTVSGTPAVVLNADPTTGVNCGTYSYVTTAPTGWQLSDPANQAATVTNGQTTTLTWTVEEIPPAPCSGTITAVMTDGTTQVTGSLSASNGAPAVTLNGNATTVTCDPEATDPTHSYTATPPADWRFVTGTTNPQTAQIDTDGDAVTVTWTVERIPPAPCDGTITASMVDGSGSPVAGSLSASNGAPDVTLNGAPSDVSCDPDAADPTHTYSGTPPTGWRLVSGTVNPQTAQIDEDGDNATLHWVVERIVIDPVCTGDQVLVNGVCTDPDPEPTPTVCTAEQVLVNGVCTTPTDDEGEVVVEEPVIDEREVTCAGSLQVRVQDLVGQEITGAAVTVNGATLQLTDGGRVRQDLPCGSTDVELLSIPDGYVFVRTEMDANAFSAQSAHVKSRKVTAAVTREATSNVAFVVDPLEVLDVEYPEPPVREPSDSPEPAPAAPDSPLPAPAPQQPVAVPVSEPTLPRTGASAGRLLALGVLLVTAGGATVGSRRRIDS